MPQLQAGYCLEGIKDELEKRIPSYFEEPHIKELLNHLSFFELETTLNLIDKDFKCHPLFLVAGNIISRGLPTRPSVFIEEIFSEVFDLTNRTDTQIGSFKFVATEIPEQKIKDLYYALFVVDPRIKPHSLYKQYTNSWENLDSKFEEEFILQSIPAYVNSSINQLIELQRTMTSIVNYKADFTEQEVDFSIEFPFLLDDKKGLVIEVDGAHHEQPSQRMLDHQRDEAVLNAGWFSTLRIKTREFDIIEEKLKRLKQLVNHWYFKIIENNYRKGLNLNSLDLMLSPLAIARIQKTLLEFIISGKLDLKKSKWDIVIIERDVTCGWLALEDLKQLLDNLFQLKGEKNPIPEIRLSIVNTEEFNKSKLTKLNQCAVYGIEEVPENISCDLLLDISVLQRPGFYNYTPIINYHHIAKIRSIHSIKSKRKFKTGDLLRYREFAKRLDNGKFEIDESKKKPLEYFLGNFFRKISFRDGQLEILSKALQTDSVIGLLPTGGGKSLTYQLASLLQPGVTLIVDPLKSLMKDQVDNLIKNLIDGCLVINSSISGDEKRINTDKMMQGEAMFTFISPERMQMQEFRDALQGMHQNKVYFNYCVIDEVHCVSEWGHDFRTSYLRLGENSLNHCKGKNRKTIPLFGLTATASFDVLTDVQRELSGKSPESKVTEDNLVHHESSIRDELTYKIIKVDAMLEEDTDYWRAIENIGKAKQKEISNIFQSEYNVNSMDNFSGLIFCPHKSYFYGVTDSYKPLPDGETMKGVFDNLNLHSISAGTFIGSNSDDEQLMKRIDQESINNQEKFINNDLNLLVATKAFGLGIDKQNIRFTIHMNYPNSVESFVQESGRAGRDKKESTCYILYNEQLYQEKEKKKELDFEINNYFHNKSFKGANKEKAIVKELLTKVYQPDKSALLSTMISQKFGVEIIFKIGDVYLFTNDPDDFDKQYGWINHTTLGFREDKISDSVDHDLAMTILEYIKDYIYSNATGSYLSFLKESPPPEKGILPILDEIDFDQTFEITIGFINDLNRRIDDITDWLQKAVRNYFNSNRTFFKKEHITDVLSKSSSFIEFIDQLETKYNRYYNNSIKLKISELCDLVDKRRNFEKEPAFRSFENIYNGYRDRGDTEKAIYRLSILGIIDDYTVDYKSKTFRLIGKKKKEQDYSDHLFNYIRKYYSEEKAKSILKEVPLAEGAKKLEKLANLLIDFIYREVAEKRHIAIKTMKRLCQEGVDKEDEGIKEFIQLYFKSKYANPHETPNNLYVDTDNLEKSDFSIIQLYIEEVVGDSINNLKHLKGACTRLQNDQIAAKDHIVILILYAYALYMLDFKNPRVLKEADEFLINGLSIYFENNGKDEKDLQDRLDYIEFQLYEKNPEIRDYFKLSIDDILIEKQLTLQLNLIKKVNNKFLKNYETGIN
jgi:ATP-dependent DNA helicase RecQ